MAPMSSRATNKATARPAAGEPVEERIFNE